MELSKKTTILFTPELHSRLVRLAKQNHTSIGALVRTACERQYGLKSRQERVDAVRELGAVYLPVSDTKRMKDESVPDPSDLMP